MVSPDILRQLVEPKLSAGDRRMIKLVDGAAECYGKYGFEGATMERIAKTCGVTRPLLSHYFKDKRELFLLVVKRIRLEFQHLAVDAIQSESTPSAKLNAYVASTFDWIEKRPIHARVWLLYFYDCSTDKHAHALHSDLVAMGHARITALLQSGVETKEFKDGDLSWKAKLIQMIITGALVGVLTEEFSETLSVVRQKVQFSCLEIAKG